MRPLISVVIATYKRPGLLFRCLHALQKQRTDKSIFEVIVVTDGPDSTVHSMHVNCHLKGLRLRTYSLKVKSGPAAARNLGWKMAHGELILFTDDDCIPDKNWVNAYLEPYCENPLMYAAYTGQVIVPYGKRPTDYEKNIAHLETAEFVTANCACTKPALEFVKGFDETFTMAWREDSDLQFNLLQKSIPIQFIQNAIVCHPVRKASWGVSLQEQKKSMFNALLYKKYPLLYRNKISSQPVWIYYSIIFFVMVALCGTLLQLPAVTFPALSVWMLLTGTLILKRLRGTTHSFKHIMEMIVTSVIIPFTSVYWTLYGSYKFKSYFL
jgi:glycosyltransferase involved in cell wall biosynthesis